LPKNFFIDMAVAFQPANEDDIPDISDLGPYLEAED
jgi:hypothetical protein